MPLWLERWGAQGKAPYHPGPYAVYRNVKDYGARGDGVTDDTEAIQRAIASGDRCGSQADSSTTSPALVYFPPGTYRVSSPIISYYNTHLMGHPTHRAHIVPLPTFHGIAVIDENPYEPGGKNWYIPQNNFFRSVSNLVLDLTQMTHAWGTGIHHQVSQSTGLYNVHFEMKVGPTSQQQGIFMENASGGFMSNLTFHGGKFGAWLGNQQFTVRHVRFSECQTALCLHWNWAWTLLDVHIQDCHVGLEMMAMLPDKQGVGSLLLSDWHVQRTPIAVQLEKAGTGRLVLDYMLLDDVDVVVQGPATPLLTPPSKTYKVVYWVKTPAVLPSQALAVKQIDTPEGPTYVGAVNVPPRPSCLVDAQGCWFGREKPQYADLPDDQFVSMHMYGAKGDGIADDTAAMQAVLDRHIGAVIYVPYGVYVLHDTLHIPVGTRLVGQAQPTLLGTGSAFQDAQTPRPVIRVGHPGERGSVEISDVIFSTRGHCPGAIVVEWNVQEETQGSVAMFDAHIRIGGTAGTEQELRQCPKDAPLESLPRANCLSLHVTKEASGYFQNVWIWTADHELDTGAPAQINVLTDRGVLIESQGPVWMYGTASEHALLYQYSLVGASNVLLAMIQTESPYFQGHDFALASHSVPRLAKFPDPDLSVPYTKTDKVPALPSDACMEDRALGLHISASQNIFVLGAGLYSFFDSYGQATLSEHACQRRLCVIEQSSRSSVWLVHTATVGTQILVSIDGEDQLHESRHREGFCSTLSLCAVTPKGRYLL